MLLNAEIKDDGYADLPRQQQAQYAAPAPTYLKADASSGKHYVDLNEAAKTYSGAWLFGTEQISVYVGALKAQWRQWCPIPAGIADGVLLRGNVIYQNNGQSRMSNDIYEGVIRTEHGTRYFRGQTTHTFYGRNFPGGSIRVKADLNIALTQRLAYNPMMVSPVQQQQNQNQYANQQAQPYYQPYRQPYYRNVAAQNAATETYQQGDSGF